MEKYTVYLYCKELDIAKVVVVEATHYMNAKTKALDMYPGYICYNDWSNHQDKLLAI